MMSIISKKEKLFYPYFSLKIYQIKTFFTHHLSHLFYIDFTKIYLFFLLGFYTYFQYENSNKKLQEDYFMFDIGNKHYEFFDMLNQHAKYFNQGSKIMYDVMINYDTVSNQMEE